MLDSPRLFSWHAAAVLGLLYVGFPWLAARLRRHRQAVLERSRLELYTQSMALQWLATILALFSARVDGRVADALSLARRAAPGRSALSFWLLLAAAGITLALMYLVAGLVQALRSRPRGEDPLVWKLVPETVAEKCVFAGVALTAGLCEEFLYRGFAVGRASLWIPLPLAALASTLAFTLTHIYQGVVGTVRAGALGAVLLAAFLYTGSLWPGICAHVLFDLVGGLYLGPRWKKNFLQHPVPHDSLLEEKDREGPRR